MSWQVKDSTSELNRLRNDLNKIRDQLFITQNVSGLPSGFLVGGATGQGSPLGGGNQVGLGAYQSTEVTITDIDSTGTPTGVFDKINLATSNMIIISGGGSFDVKFIFGTLNDGQYIILKPESGTSITLKTGGNMHLSADVTVTDTEFVICVFYEEQTSPDSNGNYVCHKIGSGAGPAGANQNLSNLLSPTAINQHLLPNASDVFDLGSAILRWNEGHIKFPFLGFGGGETKFGGDLLSDPAGADIGSGILDFQQLFINNIRLQDGGTGIGGARQIYGTPSGVRFNTPGGGLKYFWDFNNVVKFDMSDSSFTGPNIILSNTLTLNSQGFDPSGNGNFARNGVDVKVFSGGAVRNFSDISAGGGADTDLGNLVAQTDINTNLDPDSGGTRNLGDGVRDWQDLFINNIRLQSGGVGVGGARQVYGTGSGVRFNTPFGLKYFWDFNNVAVWDMSDSSLSGPNIILSGFLVLNSSGLDPVGNGTFSRNGVDVKVFSGGAVRNFSNIGATAGADTDLGNLIATAVNQDLDPDVHATRDLGASANRWNQINGVSGVFNTMNISLVATFDSATLFFIDACFMSIDTVTGLKIGTGTSQKIGFWNSTPLAQQTVASDTLANLYTLLRNIGIVG